jgi:CBS domain-containing protein
MALLVDQEKDQGGRREAIRREVITVIGEVHTHPLISISSAATVQDAARLMAECRIGALGVLGPTKKFEGIVTERDLTRFLALARDAADTKIAAVANGVPVVVNGPIENADAVEYMRRAGIRHLIVRLGDDFEIVSMRDLVPRTADSPADLCVSDAMTAPAVACRDEALLVEVAEILADRDISGMPVVNGSGDLVGVISERDLAHALGGPMVRLAVRRRNHQPSGNPVFDMPWDSRRAKDVMTSPSISVKCETRLDEVARLMRAYRVNRLPVVNEGRLVGVITRGDVLAAMAHLERMPADPARRAVLVGSAGLNSGSE